MYFRTESTTAPAPELICSGAIRERKGRRCQCMLASFDEIEELVDGVRSFEEQADLFKRRHAEELGSL